MHHKNQRPSRKPPRSASVTLRTGEHAHTLEVAPKAAGAGSSVSGGELLFLALATCYCNDYREAAKRGVAVERLEVTVVGEFGGEGEPAQSISYGVSVAARGDERAVRELTEHTDRVAEVHNTLRVGTAVTLSGAEIVPV